VLVHLGVFDGERAVAKAAREPAQPLLPAQHETGRSDTDEGGCEHGVEPAGVVVLFGGRPPGHQIEHVVVAHMPSWEF
jgi:hypothetical protein